MQKKALIRAAAIALALVGWVSVASAADVWRIAGTFNGWSTTDDSWRLERVEGRSDLYAIEREVAPGDHRFKFVKNGDWGAGHLGLAGDGETLEQPGRDIELRLAHRALVRIELNTDARRHRVVQRVQGDPVIVARFLGTPRAQRPFVVDLSDSLLSGAGRLRWSVTTDDPDAEVTPLPERGRLVAEVTPSEAGTIVVEAMLSEGERRSVERYEVPVDHLYQVRHKIVKQVYVNDMVYIGGGIYRWLFDLRRRQMGINFEEMAVLKDGEVIAQGENFNLPIGDYVVEVRHGELAGVRHADPSIPSWIKYGNWRRFEYTPAHPVESVHLLGDFNNWHGPGEERAIPLVSQTDGTYVTIENPLDGGHRYNFLIDGTRLVTDPSAERTAVGPHGRESSVLVVGPTPDMFDEPRPDHVEFRATNHEPRLQRDFNPISAAHGIVDISCVTLPDDVQRAFVIVKEAPAADPAVGELRVPMERSEDLSGFDRWTARVMTGEADVSYQFVYIDGEGAAASEVMRRTIAPDPRTPEWAKGAVWYQIFPERFRNGNPSNDPHGPGVYQMEWNADWYETQPGEEAQWRERAGLGPDEPLPERQGGELYHWVWDRRYGGDLQGIVEKMDEIADLGVTALYLNPVFEAESMHKYDATDYRHIDDNFAAPGPVPAQWEHNPEETLDPATWEWTEADRYFIDVFLAQAHARGIKVVIDGVFNHTGREFWAFQDVMEKGADSEYADWYMCEFDDEGNLESWVAWDGPSGWLPKFAQEPDGNLVEPVREHIFDITRRWMDPNGDGDPSEGIDGWRLDVALDVGLPFWEEWCALVKKINPEAIIVAEIWHDAHDVLDGPYFDTQMHYPFARAVTDWLAVRPGTPARDMARRLDLAFNETVQTNMIHQNLFGSHDTDRFVSQLNNPNRNYDEQNRIQDNGPGYVDVRPPEAIYELSLLGVAVQSGYLGAPMIYYGDEYGMWGADDPTNRKPVPWPDTGPMENRADEPVPGIREKYVHWFGLRRHPEIGPVLRFGTVEHLETGSPGVFAFERRLNEDRVVFVVNRDDVTYDARTLVPSIEASEVGPRRAKAWLLPAE